jgi:drug/metabolite transporter (DMT)-like permease
MIQRHPRRVLITLAVLAVAFFGLGGPGRNDKSGAWMYISGLSFIACLLTLVALLVLATYLVMSRRRDKRIHADL